MYIHLFNLGVITFLLSLFGPGLNRLINTRISGDGFYKFCSFYLSLQLLIYGFNKIFVEQFYAPEANLFYTPMGQMSKDILYWTVMGTSPMYSVFAGILEVIPAILLWFNYTRLAGATIAVIVMINVVMINFGFDISVKIYSCFLLLLSLFIVLEALKNRKFIRFKNNEAQSISGNEKQERKQESYKMIFKSMVIAIIMIEAFSGYSIFDKKGDVRIARELQPGAYNVELYIIDSDTIPALLSELKRPRRIFIHSKGYLIMQLMNDEMIDYKLNINASEKKLILEEPWSDKHDEYTYSEKDSILILQTLDHNNHKIRMFNRRIDDNNLPIREKGFHWTIDSYK
jgi:hypothetical protein